MDKDKFEEEYINWFYFKIFFKRKEKLFKFFFIVDDKSGVFLGGGYVYGEFNLFY